MRVLLLSALMAIAAQPAFAQGPWLGRARLGLSAGLQPEAKGFSQVSTLVEYVEPAPLTISRDEGGAPFFDIGVAFPLAGRLGGSVALSALSTDGAATLQAGIPHPFFFDALRPISGNVNIQRNELAVHAGVGVLVGGGPLDLIVSGGPSFFRVRQDVVTAVDYEEAYPYDSASFVSATLSEASASKVGYHAALDLTWRFSRVWGLGALVRYARAEVPLVAGDIEAEPMKVGGLQAAAGLRLIFP
ncbi:MAG: hypothetical protein AB7F99_08100 [Vicinamibacterales bacterium]